MKLIFDISFLSNENNSITGISRVVLSLIKEISKHHINITICGISFRQELNGHKLYSLNQIRDISLGYLDEIPNILIEGESLKIEENDIIALLGEQWLFEGCISHLREIKKEINIKVLGLVYDLVPYFMPELYWDNFSELYIDNMSEVVEISDLIYVISNNTKKDFKKFFPNFNKHIEVLRLGEDLPISISSIEREEFLLCVGTIQPRKNHVLLLIVWRRLLLDLGDNCPTLIIIGKIGWHSDELLYLIRTNPKLSQKIKIFEKISDIELARLYKSCKFTIYPSLYEGWGLPISESLSYGRFCLASSTSSMKEAGGEFCDYFSPYDSGELFNLIKKYLNNIDMLKEKEKKIDIEYSPIPWKISTKQFINGIKKI